MKGAANATPIIVMLLLLALPPGLRKVACRDALDGLGGAGASEKPCRLGGVLLACCHDGVFTSSVIIIMPRLVLGSATPASCNRCRCRPRPGCRNRGNWRWWPGRRRRERVESQLPEGSLPVLWLNSSWMASQSSLLSLNRQAHSAPGVYQWRRITMIANRCSYRWITSRGRCLSTSGHQPYEALSANLSHPAAAVADFEQLGSSGVVAGHPSAIHAGTCSDLSHFVVCRTPTLVLVDFKYPTEM